MLRKDNYMGRSASSKQALDRPILVDGNLLSQLLNGPVPVVVQTLLYNLQRVNRHNFRTERETLSIIYSKFVREIDSSTRGIILNAIVDSVQTSDFAPETLLTFIENEPSPDLVTQATHKYLALGTAPLQEPLEALEDILPMLSDPRISQRGLILAALITFGDRRVCAAVKPYNHHFNIELYKQLSASIRVASLHRCTLDYLLSWLLDLTKTAESDQYSNQSIAYLCRTLTSLIMQTTGKPVEDMKFNFGSYPFPSFSSGISSDYQSAIRTFEPLLHTLEKLANPDIHKLASTLRNPIDAKSERQSTTRRFQGNRRSQDRRVVSMAPAIERRQENRRTLERRQIASRR